VKLSGTHVGWFIVMLSLVSWEPLPRKRAHSQGFSMLVCTRTCILNHLALTAALWSGLESSTALSTARQQPDSHRVSQ
jgi:hypothetical protein